jgi:murein L,D-transpeptidase YafK
MVSALPKALSRRLILAACAGTLLVATSGTEAFSADQKVKASPRARVAVSSIGADAIERTRQRLAFAYSDLGLTLGAPVYFRLIRDQDRLEVWVKSPSGAYSRLRNFKICGKDGVLGPRQSAATGQPEGFYTLSAAQMRPQGVGYLGINLNWPNDYDRGRGWRGAPSLLQAGCASGRHYGLTDQDMEEVFTIAYSALINGQTSIPFHIFPFQMTPFRMLQIGQGPKASFWRDLEPAWRAFERTKTPPQIKVQGRRYRVSESK